jgi:hypothetical protein
MLPGCLGPIAAKEPAANPPLQKGREGTGPRLQAPHLTDKTFPFAYKTSFFAIYPVRMGPRGTTRGA